MSKVEVNTIEPQCGTTLTVGKCTTSVAVPGNVVKSNALQASDGGNIVSQSGTDITLGASGDTINLASGASQSGFGRTGTVDWVTTPKVTGDSPVTVATGSGYFLNTTAGEITINLPAGAAGSIVSLADYAATWQTNRVTVVANGSEKIGGNEDNAFLETEGQSVTLVYVDSTQGWVNTMDSTSNVRGNPPFVIATGGTPCTGAIVCTDYKVHTFTGPGTLTVTNAGPGTPSASNKIEYLVIAGGGGGGRGAPGCHTNGAGGAGGYRESPGACGGCYTVSPRGTAPAAAVVVATSPGSYPIVVGAGGAGSSASPAPGCTGSLSSALCISSAGGGGSGRNTGPPFCGQDGGSGGGGSSQQSSSGGTGNTPPAPVAQGMDGGDGLDGPPGNLASGGGGGAVGAGANGVSGCGGNGGTGATSSINATPTARAGGGAGGSNSTDGTATCGGGVKPTMDGTVNTGGGGASASANTPSPAGGGGGSGIVIIRYKFQ